MNFAGVSENDSASSEREVVKQFRKKHEKMLDDFQELGWTLSDDPDLAALSVQLFQEFQEELPVFEKAVAKAARQQTDPWIMKTCQWEAGFSLDVVRDQRKELVACAMRKDVSDDYLLDCQKRWDLSQFTEVSESYLVIGELYVRNRITTLPRYNEKDLEGEFSQKGRKDITYQLWEGGKMASRIEAVRPKINGERFVIEKREGSRFLVGFKELELLPARNNFQPKLVEYYAGHWYCIEPPISVTVDVPARYPGGEEFSLKLRGHPWITVSEFVSHPEYSDSHQYDGIMLKCGDEEYRAKWLPTGEVDVSGQTWEVAVLPELELVRPRQGKKPSSVAVVTSQLRSRLRGKFVLEFLRQAKQDLAPLQVQQEDVMHSGTKFVVLTVDPKDVRVKTVLIRERKKDGTVKPLDHLGGVIELGESPMDAGIRELWEEADWEITPDMCVPMGTSEGRDKKGTWKSHLFLIYMPWHKFMSRSDLELFDFGEVMTGLKAFNDKAPIQEWVGRNWKDAMKRFSGTNLSALLAFYMMAVEKDPMYPKSMHDLQPPPGYLVEEVRRSYEQKLLGYGERMRRVEPQISAQKIVKCLQQSWVMDAVTINFFTRHLDADKGSELVPFVGSLDVLGIARVLKAVWAENEDKTGQKYVNPFQLRQIIRGWGYTGSEDRIRKMMQVAIAEKLVKTSIQSNAHGGMVYYLT